MIITTHENNAPNTNQLSSALEAAINATDLNPTAIQFLKELDAFLQLIDKHPQIKLSKVNQSLPLKHMVAIEQQFRKIFKPTQSSKQVYHLEVHFFMVICMELKILCVDDRNRLSVTAYGKEFREYSQARQYGLIFEAFWWRISWENLMPQNSWLRNDRTQAEAITLAEILRNAPAQEDFRFDTFWEIQNQQGYQKLLQGIIKRAPIAEEGIYSRGVCVQKIIPLLAYMGILQVEVTFPTSDIEAARDPVHINQFQITGWGHRVFEILCQIEEENEEDDIEDEGDIPEEDDIPF